MISNRRLIKLALKWQKLATSKRKRITFPRKNKSTNSSSCASAKAEKGCFVVYSADQKRFLLPLEYLNSAIIRELFNIAEEEFGLPSNGPLVLPCDSEILEYVIALIKRRVSRDVEASLLTSIASCSRNSSSFHICHQITKQQSAICSF